MKIKGKLYDTANLWSEPGLSAVFFRTSTSTACKQAVAHDILINVLIFFPD
jgi:hypothetical protein